VVDTIARVMGHAEGTQTGANLIDTAECYGDHLAEELVGAAVHGNRDDWVVATKFGHQFHPEAMLRDGWSPGEVRTDHWSPTEVLAAAVAGCKSVEHVEANARVADLDLVRPDHPQAAATQ
jgi:aryl-alcohol dehydrogenase-like predicted oxidoreductase